MMDKFAKTGLAALRKIEEDRETKLTSIERFKRENPDFEMPEKR